jgi:protocatechuate 3,4-dioxygenase beta subunit
MRNLKITFIHISLWLIVFSCEGQNKRSASIVGGGCDGCELMYIDMPKQLNAVDTSAGWFSTGQKLLLTGTVYQLDGRTPAPNVLLYYWQTDLTGKYTPEVNQNIKTKVHGKTRGWVKTDHKGHYAIYTNRPGVYPDKSEPAHIHISIKEANIKNEYFIDDVVFDDDPYLLPYIKKNKAKNRGGSGIVRVLLNRDVQVAEHDIILGLNIPNYPKHATTKSTSGLKIGEDQPSFIPFHAYGPDKGTQACPVCKYGRYHGIIYFVGNHPNWIEIKKWLAFLEQEAKKREKYLKVYFVYGNKTGYSKATRQTELELLGKELNIQLSALTFVPSFDDIATEANLNQINAEIENTFIIYKQRSIVDKYINLKPSEKNFGVISKALHRTQGEYFNLPEPKHP